MERTPNQGGELQDTHVYLVPPYEEQESHDERVIREGIEAALRENREIDDRTARYIASQLHGGQASALYSLASSGNIAEEVHDELTRGYDQQTDQVKSWINWLGTYCLHREHKGPVANWAASAAAIDRDEEEAQARHDLFARISAAGVTTLGQVATIVTTEEQPERDDFHWADAATWSLAEVALTDYDDRRYSSEELDELFGETPDEQVGSVDELGWYGLVTHEGRPGGLILATDEQGFRHVREAHTDEALQAQWAAIQQEYESFYEQRDAYELAIEEASDAPSGLNPRIWVGSLADYNAGRLHGVWLDATLDPDELHHAIQFMLRNGYTPGAEEWGIFDYDEFGGCNLGEYESLEVVSRIAKGIAEHGEAFAAWVGYVGERSEEALDRFEDHYLGKFESTEAYVENLLEEGGSYEFLESVPEWLKPYVKVDTELLARDTEIELYVAEAADGGVFVFDPRC